jgi:hypothetical protein
MEQQQRIRQQQQRWTSTGASGQSDDSETFRTPSSTELRKMSLKD